MREFNEICGFCSDTRQVKNNGSAPTTKIMILYLIYSGVQKSETTSEKLQYFIFLGKVHEFLNVLVFVALRMTISSSINSTSLITWSVFHIYFQLIIDLHDLKHHI